MKNSAPSEGSVQRLVLFFRKEMSLFLTHTPGDWCKPGTIHEKNGDKFVVTIWKKLPPTALVSEGLAPCFEIRGKMKIYK